MSRVILIVDDAEECAASLEVALQGWDGLEVRTVRSAEEALAALEAGPSVAALITDLHLPAMDGFELVTRLRREERFRSLPILVTSGDSDPETPRRVLDLGADCFFAKPYSLNAVSQKLEELLHAR